jgi:hypothetical protein
MCHSSKENYMNAQKTFLFLSISFIMLITSACGSAVTATATTLPTLDPIQNTSIAETAQAGVFGTLTQIALSIPTATPTLQFTETPSQTASPLASPTSMKPMISVLVATLCRLGPGTVYDRVGELNINTMAEVYAMDPSRSYYFIQNPNQPGTYCWVWGFYATPVNSYVGVPIYTPAYTPTARYTSTPTTGPTATPSSACALISQSPANNTKFTPGAEYVDLEWIIKNKSISTWSASNVDLKFVSGTNLHKLDIYNLPADTPPDTNVKLLLDLIIPTINGTYTENWALVQGTTTLCTMSLSIIVGP